MYRHYVFSLSFFLNMYRMCTGVTFFYEGYIYMYRHFVFSLSFPLGMCRVCTGVAHWSRMPVSWLQCINRTSQCGASAVRCLTWPSSRFAGSMFSLCHRVGMEINFFDSFDCCCVVVLQKIYIYSKQFLICIKYTYIQQSDQRN